MRWMGPGLSAFCEPCRGCNHSPSFGVSLLDRLHLRAEGLPMPFVAGFLLFAVAQTPDTASSALPYVHDAAPEVRAARASGDLKIDGRLDEPAWASATPVITFTQLDPQPGQPATERTEVRVLIGSDAL